jgi:F0F1-type ATP synthase assembly protein I
MFRHLSRPIRTVLWWQIAATAALAVAAAAAAGWDAAVSAAAGGSISIIAGLASAFVASRGEAKTAGGILVGALRAEGIRIGLIVILLWLVLATYREVVAIALLGTFTVTVLIFAMAFFVREA